MFNFGLGNCLHELDIYLGNKIMGSVANCYFDTSNCKVVIVLSNFANYSHRIL